MNTTYNYHYLQTRYSNNAQEDLPNEPIKKVLTKSYNMGDICEYLIDLMTSEAYLDTGSKNLLEEIELFFSTLSVDNGSCM